MIRFVALFVGLLLLSGHLANGQSAVPDRDMVLSKKDAKIMFSLSRSKWNDNVAQAVSTGNARATGKRERGLGMATKHSHGYMIVKPDYSKEAAPDFLQVVIAYRNPTAAAMPQRTLEDVIRQAEKELGPEFQVIGSIETVAGGKMILFFIRNRS